MYFIFLHKKVIEQRKSTIPTASIIHSDTLNAFAKLSFFRKSPVVKG